MARSGRTRLRVLTANRLRGGEVVYAGPRGWTEAFAQAEVFSPEAAEEHLKTALADVRACRIVEPYLFDVEETGGGFRPLSVRETIRAGGPSAGSEDRDQRTDDRKRKSGSEECVR